MTTNVRRTVAIRADADPAIGGGHVMRCLTLARELTRGGAEVAFFCASGTPETVPALAASGLSVHVIAPVPDVSAIREAVGAWCPERADWLVIDSYASQADRETPLRSIARRILVIDDLANRPHDCDVLLDQNFGRRAEDYTGLVPAHAEVLAGPRYALLRPEFAVARPAALARRAADVAAGRQIGRILVTMGLTDIGGITERVVRAVLGATGSLTTAPVIDVVVGARATSLPALSELAAQHANIALHVDTADMAALMSRADLCIGAAGSTSWERCCLGLPTVMLVLADNQRPGAAALAVAGAADVAADVGDLAAILTRYAAEPWRVEAMSAAASAVADGGGGTRVARRLRAEATHADDEIRVRHAVGEDSALVWAWRNEPSVRALSRSVAPIAWPGHRDWYAAALADGNRHLLVCDTANGAVAVVRFDPDRRESDALITSIVVAADVRGRGLGRRCLIAALDHVARSKPAKQIYAEIAVTNLSSERIFHAAGFHPIAGPDEVGFRLWRLHR